MPNLQINDFIMQPGMPEIIARAEKIRQALKQRQGGKNTKRYEKRSWKEARSEFKVQRAKLKLVSY
jgi:hypothetical protein